MSGRRSGASWTPRTRRGLWERRAPDACCSPTSASWSPATPSARRSQAAALVVEGGHVAWVGPAADAPPRTRRTTSAAARSSRASSTATATWSSPATGPPEFAARMAGETLLRRRHPYHGRRDPRRDRRAADRPRRPGWSPRCAGRAPPPSRSRAATASRVHDEARSLAVAAAVHRGDHLPRRARRTRGHRARRSTSTWSPARCWRRRRRTPAGSTCSASAVPSTATRPARILEAGAAAGLLPRLHANQLGPGPGVQLACELGPDRGRPLHLPERRRRRRAGRSRHRSRPCCPGWSSPPGSPTRTPAGCSTPASGSRSPPTATRAPASPARCRSASRSRSARWG